MTIITAALHEDVCTIIRVSRCILLTIINIWDKICRENQNTHFIFNKFFFFLNRAFYVEKYGTAGQATDDNVVRLIRFACRITNATNTQSEYVILIAFARQKLLREQRLKLRLYVECLSCFGWFIFILPVGMYSYTNLWMHVSFISKSYGHLHV
jgi:hypothetical protein